MIARVPRRSLTGGFMAPRLLLVEQDVQLLAVLIELFTDAGYDVDVALHCDDLRRIAVESKPQLALVGGSRHGTFDAGWRAARALKAADPSLPLIMLASDRDTLAEVGNTPRGSMFAAGVRTPFPIADLLADARRLCPPGDAWNPSIERSA